MASPVHFAFVLLAVFDPALSSRYGIVSQEVCPNNGDPQKTRGGNVVWCKKDSDCQLDFACTPIEGLTHFGVQINYCCPNRIAVCSLAPQPGYGDCGRSPLKMFYFDVTSLQCKPFTVVECKGLNGNRFASKAECKRRCEATACQKGESPLHLSSELNHPVLCGESGLCPPPYKCRYDKLFRRHICCGYKREGACPRGFRTYMNILTGRPKRCRPNSVRDECPADFVCSSPDDSDVSFCCSKEKGVCPGERPPYLHPLTDHTIKCHPSANLRSECPFGYTCAGSIPGSQWGFCCLDTVDGDCPRGTTPQLNATSNSTQKCTKELNTCSFGYSCQNHPSNPTAGFCCSNKPTSSSYKFSVIDKLPTSVSETVIPVAIEKTGKSIRLVHIQQKIDKSTRKRLQRNRTRPMMRSFLECPDEREPVVYTNTSFPQQCIPRAISKCPPNADCLKAPRDPLGRFLCCRTNDSEEHDIFTAKLTPSAHPKTFATKGEHPLTVMTSRRTLQKNVSLPISHISLVGGEIHQQRSNSMLITLNVI
ncbi:hypothetical protein QR680_017691 [Steinernema hermaphroditum]|uniref:BPTI/Kunitz inhibitor domain-containing protein n=1 Tax=Steinernema hermaphroditum TaxID=289476 RepID=A0AA39HHW5_9BILA|nr:hypothetical protein QR680_017691 [Steinernema hermaphroditum]